MRMKKIFLFLFIMLTSICFVSAYSEKNLIYYFTMGDGTNSSTLYDTHQGLLMYKVGQYYSYSFQGKQGMATYSAINYNFQALNQSNATHKIYFNRSDSFTINFWINQTNATSSINPYILFGRSDSTTYPNNIQIMTNSTNIYGLYLYIDNQLKTQTCGHYSGTPNTCNSWKSISTKNTYHMITITYNKTIGLIQEYFDNIPASYKYINLTPTSHGTNAERFVMNIWLNSYDDFSIWNTTFETDDVATLWNNGDGLSYANTLASANGTQTGNQTNITYVGYYYDYCWRNNIDNVLCHNYNATTDSCDDTQYQLCGINCADTFDSYTSSQYPLINYNFSGTCRYNDYIYVNTTYSPIYYSYCYNNVLCNEYNVSGDWCMDYPSLKQCTINCADTFDSLTAEQRIYVGYNFSGQCYNNSYIYLNWTFGANNTIPPLLYDICFGRYLCHVWNTSRSSCDAYFNGNLNYIACFGNSSCIVDMLGQTQCTYSSPFNYTGNGICSDVSEYYNTIDTYPPNNNFSGTCVACVSDCTDLGKMRCSENNVQSCKEVQTNCYKYTTDDTCLSYGTTYECKYNSLINWASCENTGTSTGGGTSLNQECSGSPLDDGSMFKCMDYGMRGLISSIVIFVILLIIIVLGLMSHIDGKIIGGLAVGMAIILIFTFIYLKGLEWWIGLIIGIITAGIIALSAGKAMQQVE